MLCDLAHRFPSHIAALLERDCRLTRNFREETVTDLLMASLIGFEAFGVRVQFPIEPTTGGDMDWIFAAPLDVNGGSYLRLILQAKRAQHAPGKGGGCWFYKHLDHGSGRQAQTLTDYAATSPGGLATLPLYIFYHPASALAPAGRFQPAIEGINIVFASKVAPAVRGGCGRAKKLVSYWRNDFMSLSDLLCWPAIEDAPAPPNVAAAAFLGLLTGSYHPDLVARRLRDRRSRGQSGAGSGMDTTEVPPIEPAQGVPEDVRRAIDGTATLYQPAEALTLPTLPPAGIARRVGGRRRAE